MLSVDGGFSACPVTEEKVLGSVSFSALDSVEFMSALKKKLQMVSGS